MKAKVCMPLTKMNKIEMKFQFHLRHDPDVIWAGFECMKFLVGVKTCWYTPDFIALKKDGSVWVYEVKGFWRDDARVKIKAAAKLYPFYHWVGVQSIAGQWKMEMFE